MIHVLTATPIMTKDAAPAISPAIMIKVSGTLTYTSTGSRTKAASPLRNTFSARKYPIHTEVQHRGSPMAYKITMSVIPRKLISTTKNVSMRTSNRQLPRTIFPKLKRL